MTDLKRRQVLKTLTTGAMVCSGLTIASIPGAASADRDIELEVHYSASGASDKLLIHNPASADIEVAMQFSGDIAVPGGQLDVAKLMQNAPIKLKAGETRQLHLPRADRVGVATAAMSSTSHQALRFPVSDNVFVDRIAVVSDGMDHSREIPLLMRKIA